MLRPTKPLSSYTKTVIKFRYWQLKKEEKQKLRVDEKQKQRVEEKQKVDQRVDLKANLKENHSVVMQFNLQDEQKQWNKFLVQNLSLQVK